MEPSDVRWLDDAEMRLWWGWLRSAGLLEQRLDAELTAEHGLALGDYGVLVVLADAEGRLRMHELASQLLVSRSRLSHHVDRLVARGLVVRMRCDEDRRGAFAELTPEGWACLRKAAPTHVRGVRAYLIDLLGTDERPGLTEVFDRIRGNLGDPTGTLPGHGPASRCGVDATPDPRPGG